MSRSPSRLVSSSYFLLTTIFRLQMPLFLLIISMFSPRTRAEVPNRISEIRRVRGTARDGRGLGLLEKLAFRNSEVLIKGDRSVFFWVIVLLCVTDGLGDRNSLLKKFLSVIYVSSIINILIDL